MNLKKVSRLENTYLLFSIVGFLYVLLFTDNMNYNNLFCLPLSFCILFMIRKLFSVRYNYGVAYIVSISIIFIRYVVLPISIVYTGNYSGIGIDPDKHNMDFAIFLMIFELIMVLTTITIASIYYSKKTKGNICIGNKEITSSIRITPLNIVIIVFTIVALFIVFTADYKLLIPQDIFILGKNYAPIILEKELSGGIYILASAVKTVLLFICLSLLKDKYDKNRKMFYIILSFIVSLIYMGLMTSTKRWDMLFAGILCIYTMSKLYPKMPKSFVISFILVIFISIISISIYKFSWYIRGSVRPVHDIISYMLESFQAYFSGPRNVGQAIGMKDIFKSQISIVTFINDFLGSVPILSKVINQDNRINIYFNLYNGLSNPSQIIPMIGIGYSYFSLMSPLLSMLCEWYIIKMDYNIQKTNRMEFKFIYLNLALYLSMCMGFNTQIIFSFFITKFIPIYVLFRLNRKIVLRKNQKYV